MFHKYSIKTKIHYTLEKLYLLLGGNIGDTKKYFSEAKGLLSGHFGKAESSSNMYQSVAWGFEADQHFLNQVLIFNTNIPASDILKICQNIEKTLGRKRYTCPKTYNSRTIDIDILYIGKQKIDLPDLTVPHPQIANRAFTLQPLFEIAPDFLNVREEKTHRELLSICQDNSDVQKLSYKD